MRTNVKMISLKKKFTKISQNYEPTLNKKNFIESKTYKSWLYLSKT